MNNLQIKMRAYTLSNLVNDVAKDTGTDYSTALALVQLVLMEESVACAQAPVMNARRYFNQTTEGEKRDDNSN